MNNSETYKKYRQKNKEALLCMKPEIGGRFLAVYDWLYNNYGIILLYYSVCRSFEEQWQKRKAYLMGVGVKAAPVGGSWHNWGRAVDAVPIEDGQANWKSADWPIIINAFKSAGIDSGKDYGDTNHFQYTAGTTLTHERAANPGWKKYDQMEKQMFPSAKEELVTVPSDYATGFVRSRKKYLLPTALILLAAGAIAYENVHNSKKTR